MDTRKTPRTQQNRSRTVILVGLGNIGSHLAGLLARMGNIGQVVLVDFDSYEPRNLASQEIASSDVGQSKVRVQARRLRRITPGLHVEPIRARVEDVPLGRLRGDVILAGLDSRAARQYVNQAAWRLGISWIDAAVDAANLLARVNVYAPSQEAPCLECAWDDTDYAALEQSYPCQAGLAASAATNGSAGLGAVAAGLSAIECGKLFAGETENLLAGHQVLVNLRHHTHFVTSYRRNPCCRFDHQAWRIEGLPQPLETLRLGSLIEGLPTADGTACELGMEGHRFASRLACPACGKIMSIRPRLARRLPSRHRCCPHCDKAMEAVGFDRFEWLQLKMDSGDRQELTLTGLGFRAGDVITLRGPTGHLHFELVSPLGTGEVDDA